MYFTPIGVFCTIVPVVEANGTKTIVSLATQLIILYVAFYGFAIVVYGGAVKLIGKTSPVKFFKAIMPAALNAFGTCSSSATIPISKRCVEKELGVSNQISSIAIPLGATVNMDAVSILMSFMIMFFANACGINVSISMMVIIACQRPAFCRNTGNPGRSHRILCGPGNHGRSACRSYGRLHQHQYTLRHGRNLRQCYRRYGRLRCAAGENQTGRKLKNVT